MFLPLSVCVEVNMVFVWGWVGMGFVWGGVGMGYEVLALVELEELVPEGRVGYRGELLVHRHQARAR